MAVNALGFLDSICITVFMSPCDIAGISDRLADHDSLSTQRFFQGEARDPFGGNVYYVTMQITLPVPDFARKERNLHCDIVHVTTKWVSRLVLDHAIAAIQTSR